MTLPPAPPPANSWLDAATLGASWPAQHWHLGFPEALEARYEADTGQNRRRQLVMAGLAGLMVYDLFLLNDWLTRPYLMWQALQWRLGVVSVYGLLILALIHRGLAANWRERAIASAMVVTMVASCMLFKATDAGPGAFDPFNFGLIFLAGNIVLGMRFKMALWSSGANLLIVLGTLLSPNALPLEARPAAMAMLLATAIFTVMASYRLERAERQAYLLLLREAERSETAQAAAQRYATLSQTDALTQVANRRAFDHELQNRWAQAQSSGQAMAMLMVDIDHFKAFNDRHGHPAGDACLQRVTQLMRQALREDDFIARMGGEEFAVLLSPSSCTQVTVLAERLRTQVEEAGIAHDGGPGVPVVSISLGVARACPGPDAKPQALVAAADQALYQAKHLGRNCWVLLEQDDAKPTMAPTEPRTAPGGLRG